ncbi:MAG: 5-formyltetrahydrofolate cyclo-ligase [Gammaproteobacteria bacterium]|nr:5-formyltetrahydrofolate cyclo-ligase [Gammaproteobacteria bacterium]
MSDGTELRKMLRSRRLALSPGEQRTHALAAARHFLSTGLLLRCNTIALYITNNGELDPAPLAEQFRRHGKRIFLPVLRARPKQALWFREHPPHGPLQQNRFGIPEPLFGTSRLIPPWGLDLILLPLVAFDPDGNRMGMGGGFYDRTLAYLRRRHCWRTPLLIGLAHECQHLDRIDPNPWDVPVNGIITEAGFYRKDPSTS